MEELAKLGDLLMLVVAIATISVLIGICVPEDDEND